MEELSQPAASDYFSSLRDLQAEKDFRAAGGGNVNNRHLKNSDVEPLNKLQGLENISSGQEDFKCLNLR